MSNPAIFAWMAPPPRNAAGAARTVSSAAGRSASSTNGDSFSQHMGARPGPQRPSNSRAYAHQPGQRPKSAEDSAKDRASVQHPARNGRVDSSAPQMDGQGGDAPDAADLTAQVAGGAGMKPAAGERGSSSAGGTVRQASPAAADAGRRGKGDPPDTSPADVALAIRLEPPPGLAVATISAPMPPGAAAVGVDALAGTGRSTLALGLSKGEAGPTKPAAAAVTSAVPTPGQSGAEAGLPTMGDSLTQGQGDAGPRSRTVPVGKPPSPVDIGPPAAELPAITAGAPGGAGRALGTGVGAAVRATIVPPGDVVAAGAKGIAADGEVLASQSDGRHPAREGAAGARLFSDASPPAGPLSGAGKASAEGVRPATLAAAAPDVGDDSVRSRPGGDISGIGAAASGAAAITRPAQTRATSQNGLGAIATGVPAREPAPAPAAGDLAAADVRPHAGPGSDGKASRHGSDGAGGDRRQGTATPAPRAVAAASAPPPPSPATLLPGAADGGASAHPGTPAPATGSDAPASTTASNGAPAASATPPPVHVQLARGLDAHGGTGTLDLTLSPEELGRVRLSLSHHDGGVAVRIAADRPDTADLIRRHLPELHRDLRALGHGDVSFSFSGGASGGARQDRAAMARPAAPPTGAQIETTGNATAAAAVLTATSGQRPGLDGGLDLRF